MRVTLFGDRVLIKPDEKEKLTSGGIVIPDSVNQNKNKKGTVIKHGDGAYDERTGDFTPITVKEGDRIIYDTTAQIMQSPEWDNLLLMRESDLLTIIKQ
jgi:chaperonin GroES